MGTGVVQGRKNQLIATSTQGSHAFVNKKFPTFSIPKFAQKKKQAPRMAVGGYVQNLRTTYLAS